MINKVIKYGKEYYQINKTGKLYPTEKKALRQERIIKRNGS